MTPRTLFDECGIGDFVRLRSEFGIVIEGVVEIVWMAFGTHPMLTIRGTNQRCDMPLAHIDNVECIRRRQETEVE